jgi:hypothetical protein
MAIPVFLSAPKPCNASQAGFIDHLRKLLAGRGIDGKTLGVNEYDMRVPLAGVRRIMLESNGIMVVAFARYEIKSGRQHFFKDGKCASKSIAGTSMTSPWCQIEAGMGFQLGLPILILRERGVWADGVLQHGVMGAYMPEFDLSTEPTSYFGTEECRQLIQQFEAQVLQYRDRKGYPPYTF